MSWRLRPSSVVGETHVPGDKSIAHRALMLGAMAEGRSILRNLPTGADVRATASALRQLGTLIYDLEPHLTEIIGTTLHVAEDPVDCANSGTTMRLLAGILAGHSFNTVLTGDASLSRRPMRRIIEPLENMGAQVCAEDGHAPLSIYGDRLHGIVYRLPVASAQVKSAVLLAGMLAEGKTSVYEPLVSRDHTERLLTASGVAVRKAQDWIEIDGDQRPSPLRMEIPGDISSAAFLFAAAAMTGGSVCVRDVGVNPTRTRFLGVLEEMGAIVRIENLREVCNEPYADVTVAGSVHSSITLAEADVPLLIDELPLVALLATQCHGTTVIRGASELRVKESDRLSSVAKLLDALGASVQESMDGLVVRGPTRLSGGVTLTSEGDHRIGMLGAVAGLAAQGESFINGTEAVAVSFPAFADTLRMLGAKIDSA
ncbi:MAG TPA: 3-phosphoshikimate 1-carboxyvinyltransferase [Chloroflexota bacterium]